MEYNHIISKLFLTIKCLILMRQCGNYVVFVFYIWVELFRVDQADGQDFLLNTVIQLISIHVLRHTVIFLHSQENRRLIKNLVNEIIYITRTIESKFGMIYHCELSLLSLYIFKLYLVYILLDSLWYKPYFLWINFLYWLLGVLRLCLLYLSIDPT